MSAGVPKFVTVNLQQLNSKFQDGETVDLATLQEKRLLNLSGREAKLPLKVTSAPLPCIDWHHTPREDSRALLSHVLPDHPHWYLLNGCVHL